MTDHNYSNIDTVYVKDKNLKDPESREQNPGLSHHNRVLSSLPSGFLQEPVFLAAEVRKGSDTQGLKS